MAPPESDKRCSSSVAIIEENRERMSRYERTRERRRTLRTVFGRCYDVLDRRHVVIDVVSDRQVSRRRH